MPNMGVADIERLYHGTVKDLDEPYMQQQVARAGMPAPRAIGIDEISIRKGHNYRVVVSDLSDATSSGSAGRDAKRSSLIAPSRCLGGGKDVSHRAGRDGYVSAVLRLCPWALESRPRH